MPYTKTNWVNGSQPAISAHNLNKIEQGIFNATETSESNSQNIQNIIQILNNIQIGGEITVSDLLLLAHPVGSIYQSTNLTSPATLFGGTWEQIKDMFLLSAGDTYFAGDTGGSATNTHQHFQTVSNDGSVFYATVSPTRSRVNPQVRVGRATNFGQSENAAREDSTYEETINIMPPYTVVYCWRRTA